MNNDLNRAVPVNCPTCGGTLFADPDPGGDDSRVVKCQGCGRELTIAALVEENGENVATHLDEMLPEVLKVAKNRIHDQLNNAFKGNKHIKFK